MSAAKRLSEALSPGSSSQISPHNQNKISHGAQNFAQGSSSDDPGHKAGFRRTLSQQQVSQMAAQLEERGRFGARRYVNPQNARSKKQSNYAYAITNEGGAASDLDASTQAPMSHGERVAQHDERWRFNPALRSIVGIKVYGR